MYLNKLTNEQKELFLDLCIHAAMADNKFVDEEKDIIIEYCLEMGIPERYEIKTALDDVIEKLSAVSTKKEMRIVYMEIMALLLSDRVFDEKEKVFVEKIATVAEITDEEKEMILNAVQELFVVYGNISSFINK